MKYITLALFTIILASCSSRKLQKDYIVVDSSHQDVPEWVEDLDEWIDDTDDDAKRSRYYIYTSDPKNDRQISCELADARAKNQVAGEVSTFIKQNLASTISGDPKARKEKLDQYVEETLVKDVQANLVGVQTVKTYWEKRRFQKELGAKKNKDAYTCTKLIRVSKKNLKKLFKIAYQKLDNKSKKSQELQAKLKAAIDKAEKAYTE
jgi:hypothetical protein